jgi:hypothetical protein
MLPLDAMLVKASVLAFTIVVAPAQMADGEEEQNCIACTLLVPLAGWCTPLPWAVVAVPLPMMKVLAYAYAASGLCWRASYN